jgi:hypothetical protein
LHYLHHHSFKEKIILAIYKSARIIFSLAREGGGGVEIQASLGELMRT